MSSEKKPEIIVFAGPNGSGKTTVTKLAKVIEPYINADDMGRVGHLSELEAAKAATSLREKAVEQGKSFTFETVMSTERNLFLLQKAKEKGYFIRCIYVLTTDVKVNIGRVKSRVASGGHDVPTEKIKERYDKALKLIPEIVKVCDVMHIYDNTTEPFRIFKRRKDEYFYWENDDWSKEKIAALTKAEL